MRFYQGILVLHLLGATIWTGGHLILCLRILPSAWRTGQLERLQQFEQSYEVIGMPALFIQVSTGLWLANRYIPKWSAWFTLDNVLSSHISAKLLLLGVTIGLALHARFRLIPRLEQGHIRTLGFHIIGVTLISVLFVWVGLGFRTGGVF